MDAAPRLVSADTKLKALALFTLARSHSLKAREFELALYELLDLEEDHTGFLSDGIFTYSERPSFERAFAQDGFDVKDESDA